MQISKDLWIAGGYYVDFDILGQFRIIGPNNELYLGLVDIPRHKISIEEVKSESKGSKLSVLGKFKCKSINLYYPAMDDIRTVRQEVIKHGGIKSFLEVRQNIFDRLVPQQIKQSSEKISFVRRYDRYWYKSVFIFKKGVSIERIDAPYRGFEIKTKKQNTIEFEIRSSTNDLDVINDRPVEILCPCAIDFKVFGKNRKKVEKYWARTELEVKHLINWKKTSGDRFGTVFPRDWMESADLGVHDITDLTKDYMYRESYKNINKRGQGWHEDVVGEYKYEHQIAGKDLLDRKMIDIEPHYLFGIKELSSDFLVDVEIKEKAKRVANYILKSAREKKFIVFKERPKSEQKEHGKYYEVGNWRDSAWAFKKKGQVMAPFDVNAVFYPAALREIKKIKDNLDIKTNDIDDLIRKWDSIRNRYKFTNEDGKVAYALALYGDKEETETSKEKLKRLEVNHLDESYLYTYLGGTKAELDSFCDRLLDKKYFYTESGPMLVASDNQYGYTTEEYHGQVIWTKQVAYVILGLSKHLKKAIIDGWEKELQKKIRETILTTCERMIFAYSKMKAIPELHIDDKGQPKLYTDQEGVRANMSVVQLWSAVGARRIFRKYWELKTEKRYQI